MTESSESASRRRFLKVLGVTSAGAALAITGIVTSQAEAAKNSTTKPDLLLEKPLKPGERLPVIASSSYLAVHAIKIRATPRKARCLVQCQFKSREIKGAQLLLTLLDKNGNEIERVIHREDVGPKILASKIALGVNFAEHWDRERLVWMDFQQHTMAAAKSFKLEINKY